MKKLIFAIIVFLVFITPVTAFASEVTVTPELTVTPAPSVTVIPEETPVAYTITLTVEEKDTFLNSIYTIRAILVFFVAVIVVVAVIKFFMMFF